MLYRAKALKGMKLDSQDGDIGMVKEFFFDDQYWAVRYLIADTGNWLSGRQVLISPQSLGRVEPGSERIQIRLTKEQIENSPPLDSAAPVTREYERDYYRFFGLPMYWSGSNMWGSFPYIVKTGDSWDDGQGRDERDVHLNSTKDITGRHIQAVDGEIGHVDDFVICDESWAIRYLIVDTQNWWPGKKVLVAPHWIDSMSWRSDTVLANLSRETIKESPEYTDDTEITRDYEDKLHRHYERRGYWIDEPAAVLHA